MAYRTNIVDLNGALQIVLDLARGNIIDPKDVCGDEDLERERARQIEACNTVEDMVVNQFGDDS